MKNKLGKIMLAVGTLTLALGVGACNTVKGLGNDISSVGQAGSDAIN